MIFKTVGLHEITKVSTFRQRRRSRTKTWDSLEIRCWIEKEEAAKEAERSNQETVPGEHGILGTK